MTELRLPLPPKELSPNWRGHWATKAKAVKDYRDESGWSALAKRLTFAGPVAIQYTFRFPDKRLRDPDNLITMMKPALDGLRDASMILNDTSEDITLLPVEIEYGAKDAAVIVTVRANPPAPGRLPPKLRNLPYDKLPGGVTG